MLPVKKTSRTRTRTRRAHHALKPAHTIACPMCGRAKLPYAACEDCGFVNAKVQLTQKQEEE